MWQVGEAEWKPLVQAHGAMRFRRVKEWRQARGLPQWIVLAEADNELPIDLDNPLAIDTLVELAKGQKQVRLIELYPGPDQLLARGPEGRFLHELVVPFVRARDTRRRARGIPSEVSQLLRSFLPGSEWLFLKLYTSPATADEILRDVVRPVVEQGLAAGALDRWFFIRYDDPDWHLRLRFKGDPARLASEVLPALQAASEPLRNDGRIWRIQIDTYEREVERYGGAAGMQLSERFFQADSEAVVALADLFAEDARGDLRWRLTLAGMDLLLGDLRLDLDARIAAIRETRDAFAAEFQADTDFEHQLGARFRKERKALGALLNSTVALDAALAKGVEVLRHRSRELTPVIADLRACAQAGRLSVPLAELATSYLHMHANRMLRSAHRAQEVVLYDFPARLYESQAARSHCSTACRAPSSSATLLDEAVLT
jgi:thiopeptide-type bacteriocin biosynthesis protein